MCQLDRVCFKPAVYRIVIYPSSTSWNTAYISVRRLHFAALYKHVGIARIAY